MASQTSEGPANVNVVINVSQSIVILAVNPVSNVCVPVVKLCENKENEVVKKSISTIFLIKAIVKIKNI